jgi:hemerythrin-like domain-containing protein
MREPREIGSLQTAVAEFGPFAIPPVQEELLAAPLDYLFAESCRILRLCDMLDMVAFDPGRVGRLAAPALIDFLRKDFPRHLDDMEQDLLPLVEGALLVGDDADDALAQLSREHAVDRRRAEQLIAALEPLASGRAIESNREVSALAHAFAEAQRRHIAWEGAILYPLARARLRATLLRELADRFKRRRMQKRC